MEPHRAGSHNTSRLQARVIMDVLGVMVEHGHLGTRLTADERAAEERERNRAAGVEDATCS